MIRNATQADSNEISDIYNYYIINTYSTFETEPVSPSEIATRINQVQEEFKLPWLVLEEEGKVTGYTYATQWKIRAAYKRTVETTVYIDHQSCGRGLGSQLYIALIERLNQSDHHSLLGGIALPNDVSIALHEKLGYIKVGQLKEVGYKLNRWVDVGYWELLLK